MTQSEPTENSGPQIATTVMQSSGPPAGLKSLIRSLVINLAGPYIVYVLAAPYFPKDSVIPLLLSTAVPVIEMAVIYARQRAIDVVAVISIVQLVAGIAVTLFAGTATAALEGHALMPAALGLVFGASILLGRPLITNFARQTMAGDDAARQARFDEMAKLDGAKRAFRNLTLLWTVSLCAESAVLIFLVRHLTVANYLLVSPILTYGVLGGLIWYGITYGRRAARRGAAESAGK